MSTWRSPLTLAGGLLLAFLTAGPVSAADDDDEEDDAVPATACERQASEDGEDVPARALRHSSGNSCFALGGDLSFGQQRVPSARMQGLPILLTPRGQSVSGDATNTVQAVIRMDWNSFTDMGRLGVSTELNWVRATGDGTRFGSVQLNRLMGRIGPIQGGYGDSITGFFAAPIEASAFVPKRSVGLISYEQKLSESAALTAAIETGPVLRSLNGRLVPIALDQRPYFALRWLQTLDWGEVHLAAVATNRRISASVQRPDGRSALGYALTAGIRAQFEVLGQQDEASLQMTYADNAVSYLGAALDLGGVAGRVAQAIEARGTSGTAAYTRNWTSQWSSTVFGSIVNVVAARGEADPKIRSLRYGGNLVWKPLEGLSLGVELSRQRVNLNVNPAVLNASRRISSESTILSLTVQATF